MAATIPTIEDIETLIRRVLREELERGRPEEMVSIEEAAERTDVSTATIRRAIKAGRLPARRVGRQYRIPASALRPAADGEVVELAHAARFRRGPGSV